MKGGKQLKLKETAFPPLNLPWPISAPKKLALWIYKPHTNATLVSFGSSIYPRPFFFCFSYAFPRPHLSSFPLSPPGTSFVAFAWRFLIALCSNHEHRLLRGFWTKYRAKRRAMAAFDCKCSRARGFDQNFYCHGGRVCIGWIVCTSR